jgi:proteasome lid subunit RPN8/RPN11
MFYLSLEDWAALLDLAERAWPREICGLLLLGPGRRPILRLRPSGGHSNTRLSFHIADDEVKSQMRQSDPRRERLVGCFHSHTLGPARPSRRDKEGAAAGGGMWLIFSPGRREARLFEWQGGSFRRRRLRLI